MRSLVIALRTAGLLLLVSAGVIGIARLAEPGVADVVGTAGGRANDDVSLARIVVDAASCLADAAAVSVLVSTLLVVAAASTPSAIVHRTALRAVPAALLRIIVPLCGLALVAQSETSFATSTTTDHTRVTTACTAGETVSDLSARLDGLPFPDLPVSVRPNRTRRDRRAAPRRRLRIDGNAPRGYVVRPGDSLWSIGKGDLPADASATRVIGAIEMLERANPKGIGPDPDLIYPGTLLIEPEDTR